MCWSCVFECAVECVAVFMSLCLCKAQAGPCLAMRISQERLHYHHRPLRPPTCSAMRRQSVSPPASPLLRVNAAPLCSTTLMHAATDALFPLLHSNCCPFDHRPIQAKTPLLLQSMGCTLPSAAQTLLPIQPATHTRKSTPSPCKAWVALFPLLHTRCCPFDQQPNQAKAPP